MLNYENYTLAIIFMYYMDALFQIVFDFVRGLSLMVEVDFA